MANEKDIKNEVTENKTEAPAANAPIFEAADAFAWRDENANSGEQSGQETIYANTGIRLQRRIEIGKDNREYQNFAIAFMIDVNGKKVVQTAYFSPLVKTTPMFELLAAIFGDNEYYPADIIKTVTPKTDTRAESTRYSLRLSAEGEFGNKVVCNMTTISRGDSMVFNNLVDYLKSRKVIE